MIDAYLFIHLDSTYNGEDLLDAVREIPKIKEAHRLYGSYDMVIYMEVDSTEELKKVTLDSIRELQFVESTTTFISLESYKKQKE